MLVINGCEDYSFENCSRMKLIYLFTVGNVLCFIIIITTKRTDYFMRNEDMGDTRLVKHPPSSITNIRVIENVSIGLFGYLENQRKK